MTTHFKRKTHVLPKFYSRKKYEKLKKLKVEELKSDERLLSIIRGTNSLLSAEFKTHDKCQLDYTRRLPATKKRERTVENVEEVLESDVIGPRSLRKRQNLSQPSLHNVTNPDVLVEERDGEGEDSLDDLVEERAGEGMNSSNSIPGP